MKLDKKDESLLLIIKPNSMISFQTTKWVFSFMSSSKHEVLTLCYVFSIPPTNFSCKVTFLQTNLSLPPLQPLPIFWSKYRIFSRLKTNFRNMICSWQSPILTALKFSICGFGNDGPYSQIMPIEKNVHP